MTKKKDSQKNSSKEKEIKFKLHINHDRSPIKLKIDPDTKTPLSSTTYHSLAAMGEDLDKEREYSKIPELREQLIKSKQLPAFDLCAVIEDVIRSRKIKDKKQSHSSLLEAIANTHGTSRSRIYHIVKNHLPLTPFFDDYKDIGFVKLLFEIGDENDLRELALDIMKK